MGFSSWTDIRPAFAQVVSWVRPAGRTYLEVKVLYTLGKEKCQPNGKGVAGDCESGGSCRQSAGLTNRKRIEAASRGEQASICEAQYLHGTRRRRSDRHKREGGCAIPGEIW